jgi:hypothetical protein
MPLRFRQRSKGDGSPAYDALRRPNPAGGDRAVSFQRRASPHHVPVCLVLSHCYRKHVGLAAFSPI